MTLSYYSEYHQGYLYLKQVVKDSKTGYVGEIKKIIINNNGIFITVFFTKNGNKIYHNDNIQNISALLIKNT